MEFGEAEQNMTFFFPSDNRLSGQSCAYLDCSRNESYCDNILILNFPSVRANM